MTSSRTIAVLTSLVSATLGSACGTSSNPVGAAGGSGAATAGGASAGGSDVGGAANATGGTGTDAGNASGSGNPGVGGSAESAGSAGLTAASGSRDAGLDDGGTAAAGSGATAGSAGASSVGASGGPATDPSWGTPVGGGPAISGPSVQGTVTVSRTQTVGKISQGFAGFSFEKTHITNGSFTGKNAALVALFKLLGPTVIRLGADDVDKETWAPATQPGTGGRPYSRLIGTKMVDDYADFLSATGAQTIYGVDLTGAAATPANTAEEAAYASTKLGSSLYGFEIGNEINRSGTWASLKSKWESFANAILASVPTAQFVGPAGGGGNQSNFDAPFAKDEASKVILLTQHYYAGTANTATATLANLLVPDPFPSTSSQGLIEMLQVMTSNATTNHIRDGFRVGECNTFSGHGQNGLSNALISALWSFDFLFTSAKYGASGVNFHGGEPGMDGSTLFYYSPIQETNGVVTGAAPLFYGMLMFSLAGVGDALATTASVGSTNLTAYAISRSDGATSVILDNKDTMNNVKVSVDVGIPVASASAIYLQGPSPVSLTATSGMTLAGAGITAAGAWARKPPYALASSGNSFTVTVPPASAALVRVQ